MKKFTSDVVIGLEIHVELATDTKLFCGCSTHGDDKPNSRTCEVCLGHPGSKPVLNKKAVDYALKLGLALNCKVAPELIFSRKSYFYPDMSKNYQITQYEIPLGEKGKLRLNSGKTIGITRVHMEEDPASLVHPSGMQKSSYVLVDYNRSGDPLVEVVTEPDLSSPEEARDFMKQLILILNYLEIFDVNRCIIKADVNISIKESNYTRVEIKNITGFKDIERALNYEVERQKKNIKEIVLETRAWDSDKGITFSLRKKEVEVEYGYIIDPDLVRIDLDSKWISSIKKDMPELAEEKLKKYEKEHGSVQSMAVIAKDLKLAKFFEEVISDKKVDPKLASHWVELELKRVLNYNKKKLGDTKIKPKHVVDIVKLIQDKRITEQTGRRLIEKLVEKDFDIEDYVKKEGLEIISDERGVEKVCKEVIKDNASAVEQYKNGEEKAIHFIIGQIMRKTKGKAKPDLVNTLVRELIK
ncbi:Asp-tRNA(Asn)/Glu-tRNA(Gln) amidotransferase GatCAB subunit B [Candidatus Woesearchaeota archaeon B3_Woes]|nr:MAG: Asp-tRNA(Asn)/Glu-tRNA(Gln) amidotransferase GatCAB subunit B [Candidatus Woesearchaeota archaeon B3_Woes]